MYKLIYRFRQPGLDKPIQKEKIISQEISELVMRAKRNKEVIKIDGVGLIPHGDILQIQEINQDGSGKKDYSRIVQYAHNLVSEIPNLRGAGYQVERVNYRGETPIYTQIAFCPKKLWDTKSADDHQGWVEKVIKIDQEK